MSTFFSETQTDRQAERHPDRQDKFVIDTNGWFYRYGHKYLAYPQDSLICCALGPSVRGFWPALTYLTLSYHVIHI